MKCKFAAILLSLAGAAGAEPIVVTASRTSGQVGQGDVSVVTRDAIDALQPVNLLEALDRLAGVRAFQKGGEGGGSYLSIRGGEPNFTLVLLDGVKVGDPTNSQGGAFDFGQIDPAAIERIEVVRGGLSAVHGADALSGAVNLRLMSPGQGRNFGSVRFTTDTRGRIGGDATTGLSWEKGGILLSGGAYDSGEGTKGSDLQRRQLVTKISQELSGWSLTGLALHARSERIQFPEDSGGVRLAVLRDRETGTAQVSVAALNLIRNSDSRLIPHFALNWSRQDANSNNPGIAPGVLDGVPSITSDTRFGRVEAVADIKWQIRDGLVAVGGGSYLEERGKSRGTVDFGVLIPADFRIDRHVTSGFVEATLGSAARATIGVRHDNPSSGVGEWTGRVSGYLPIGGVAVTASWSQGYKLPSLFALAYPLIANSALRPEQSESWEGGIERDWTDGRIRISYFRNRFTDLIDFDPALFTNVNRNRVVTQGIEGEARLRSRGWSVEGSVTYLDVSSLTVLRSRPEWQAAARLVWNAMDRLKVDAAIRLNSSFADSSVATGSIRASGHTELDVGAQHQVSDMVTLAIVVRNLTAAKYENSVGVPGERRTLRANLSARF